MKYLIQTCIFFTDNTEQAKRDSRFIHWTKCPNLPSRGQFIAINESIASFIIQINSVIM